MATQAQIDAARRNGAKSRGPVTPEGKQTSAQNAIKHGLLSKYTVVLNNERDEAFEQMLNAYVSHFAPANTAEEDLVVEIAVSRWRLRRVWQLETSLIDQELADQALAFNAKNQHMIIESRRTAAAWKALATPDGPLALLNRYEARNSYTRSLRELLLLRGPKPAQVNLPNEPKPAVTVLSRNTEIAASNFHGGRRTALPSLPLPSSQPEDCHRRGLIKSSTTQMFALLRSYLTLGGSIAPRGSSVLI